jgi:hypothetical protein
MHGRPRAPRQKPGRFTAGFIPDGDAQNLPPADKRAAYALERVAFRLGRIEQSLGKIAAAPEAVLSKT